MLPFISRCSKSHNHNNRDTASKCLYMKFQSIYMDIHTFFFLIHFMNLHFLLFLLLTDL